MWLAVLGAEIVLFSCGKQPHVERFAIANLDASRYNAVMSELMLVRGEQEIRAIAVSPLDGVKVLTYIVGERG